MITRIKDKLRGNLDLITYVLEELGCEKISPPKGDYIRFGRDENSSGVGNSLNIETLAYVSFSRDIKGDIFVLTMDALNISMGESIKYLANKLNLKLDYSERKEVKLPFGGFYKNLSKSREVDESPPNTYPISTLNEYGGIQVSKMFLEDNITAKTQEIFHIGYDVWTDRITIPWHDVDGSLCGLVGRMNKYDIGESRFKYLALLHINKTKILFGLNINYKSILSEGRCYVFESEKATMQMYGFGVRNSVGLGCKTLSLIQSRLIKSMFVDCVLCFDEGVLEDEMKKECLKAKIKNPFFTNRVGYIYDKDGLYLKKGSKCSPSDLGIDIFNKLVEECIVWV